MRNSDIKIIGPDEVDSGVATGLAPFEEESSILLDDFSFGSPIMLDDFNVTSEVVYLDDLFGNSNEENVDSDELIEEPGEGVEALGEEADAELTGDDIGAQPPEGEEGLVTGEPETALPPSRPVFAFVCECAVDTKELVDEHGRMRTRPEVHVFALPCAGMVKPSWIELAMDRDASGVMVIACEPGSCRHRTGSCILRARWKGERRPMLKSRIDRSRVRLIQHHPVTGDELMKKIEGFLGELGRMDSNA